MTMTGDFQYPIQHKQAVEHFQKICNEAGLKVTHQRLQIYLQLLSSTEHPTAENVYSELHQILPSLSQDTVYRTLATLENLGLVKRVQTVNAQTRYEACMQEHHHFICTKCEKIIDFDWSIFETANLPERVTNLGSISSRTITLSGVCASCLAKI